VRTSRRQLTLIESETRQLELAMAQRLHQRSCIRVLVSQFDGFLRLKMELREKSTEAVHVRFATGDFRVVSRTIVFDQCSSVRVSAVLPGVGDQRQHRQDNGGNPCSLTPRGSSTDWVLSHWAHFTVLDSFLYCVLLCVVCMIA